MARRLTPRHRRRRGVLVVVAVLLAAAFWVVDALLDAHVFGTDRPDVRLFPKQADELWMRSIVVVLLLAFGAYAERSAARQFRQQRSDQATMEQRVAERAGELGQRSERLAVLRERERLARELHDAVTQTLFSIGLIADSLPRLLKNGESEAREGVDKLRRMARAALAEMRCLLLELRPGALEDAALDELLGSVAEAETERSGLAVDLDVARDLTVAPEIGVAVYRIAREALGNVARHSGARRAVVKLTSDARGVTLRVSDEGQGFDRDHVPPDRLGIGIMRERARATGAELAIDSIVGGGTRVTVRWNPDPPAAARSGAAARDQTVAQVASKASRST